MMGSQSRTNLGMCLRFVNTGTLPDRLERAVLSNLARSQTDVATFRIILACFLFSVVGMESKSHIDQIRAVLWTEIPSLQILLT